MLVAAAVTVEVGRGLPGPRASRCSPRTLDDARLRHRRRAASSAARSWHGWSTGGEDVVALARSDAAAAKLEAGRRAHGARRRARRGGADRRHARLRRRLPRRGHQHASARPTRRRSFRVNVRGAETAGARRRARPARAGSSSPRRPSDAGRGARHRRAREDSPAPRHLHVGLRALQARGRGGGARRRRGAPGSSSSRSTRRRCRARGARAERAGSCIAYLNGRLKAFVDTRHQPRGHRRLRRGAPAGRGAGRSRASATCSAARRSRRARRWRCSAGSPACDASSPRFLPPAVATAAGRGRRGLRFRARGARRCAARWSARCCTATATTARARTPSSASATPRGDTFRRTIEWALAEGLVRQIRSEEINMESNREPHPGDTEPDYARGQDDEHPDEERRNRFSEGQEELPPDTPEKLTTGASARVRRNSRSTPRRSSTRGASATARKSYRGATEAWRRPAPNAASTSRSPSVAPAVSTTGLRSSWPTHGVSAGGRSPSTCGGPSEWSPDRSARSATSGSYFRSARGTPSPARD